MSTIVSSPVPLASSPGVGHSVLPGPRGRKTRRFFRRSYPSSNQAFLDAITFKAREAARPMGSNALSSSPSSMLNHCMETRYASDPTPGRK